jgi:hypothetical protein
MSILATHTGFSQIGGKRSFEFINVPPSARLAALGGINVSLMDRDVNFFYSNPALNRDTLSGMASVNYQFQVADIGHAAFTYAHRFNRIGMLTMGIQHMNYGTLQGYDPSGNETTTFRANETMIMAAKSHQIGHYNLAASVKGIFSNLAGYKGGALAIDIGGTFVHPAQQLTIGLVLKNIGLVFSDFTNTSASKLPFDVQAGVTFKPNHMPVRFSVAAFNLTKPNVTYNDPAAQNEETTTLQRIFTHMNFGGELLIHKNVNVLLGYNYFNYHSWKLEGRTAGAGLSFGFSAMVKNLDFVFSRTNYVAGKGAYTFTLSTNINKIFKRQKL